MEGRPAHSPSKHDQDDGDSEAQQFTISRRQGGKRVKAAAAKHPSPQRKQQQQSISVVVQPSEESTSIRVSPSSAFSYFVSSSTSSSSASSGGSSSGPSSAAAVSSASSTPSAFPARSLSIASSTSTIITILPPSLSALPALTPSSALATTLSSFSFSAVKPLPSTLECSEELDDSRSTTQHDEDEYVLVDKKPESSTPVDDRGGDEEEEDEVEAVEYDDVDSEGDADDEGDEPLSDDDTVEATAALPATTSSLPTSVSTSQSCSASSASNPSPCPLPSALITSYYTPDPRAYSLSLSRSTDTITTIASILEPLDPDLLAHMFDTEQLYHPLYTYMQHQPLLEPAMRPVLLDWMVEVSQEFGLQRETTQLAANFVDRFLTVCPAALYSANSSSSAASPASSTFVSPSSSSPPAASPVSLPITRLNFQLLGITSLFLASKLEEIYPPTANDFATTTDGAYCTAHIAAMERLILDKLQWRLQAVTPFAWCKALLKCACRTVGQWFDDEVRRVERRMEERGRERIEELERLDERLAELDVLKGECISYLLSVDLFTRCMEFIDATLLDVRFLSFYPSALASAALLLVYSSPPSAVCLELLLATSTYSLSSLLPAIQLLSAYSGMEWRGVVKSRSYFSASEGKERVEERWSRQTHWDAMLDWKEQVERDERERYKADVDDEADRHSELEADEADEGADGGGCVDVCESSLSSYGASGVGLTSSLASTSEWSTLDSELDRRD